RVAYFLTLTVALPLLALNELLPAYFAANLCLPFLTCFSLTFNTPLFEMLFFEIFLPLSVTVSLPATEPDFEPLTVILIFSVLPALRVFGALILVVDVPRMSL